MKYLKRLLKMIALTYLPQYASKVARSYWQNTQITHFEMSERKFDFYYQQLFSLINPKREEKILDYGGGNGEIAYRFCKDGYSIFHCDINETMVKNAQRFGVKSSLCAKIKGKFHIIIVHNAFFYIHPRKQKDFLKYFFDLLEDRGKLYITDTPDYDKRDKEIKLYYFLSSLFPVYQIDLAGFYIKHKKLIRWAQEIGFIKITKVDSWSNYRSHWILEK